MKRRLMQCKMRGRERAGGEQAAGPSRHRLASTAEPPISRMLAALMRRLRVTDDSGRCYYRHFSSTALPGAAA